MSAECYQNRGGVTMPVPIVFRPPSLLTHCPGLPWNANMAPQRGDEGEARVCVCS
jgi:hypothetical protein